MQIGFDAKRITHNSTGLGNYSRFIVNILSSFYPENSYYLYSPSEGREHLRKQVKEASNLAFRYPSGSVLKAYWRSKGVLKDLKKDHIEIFHGLSNELPWGLKKAGIKSIVTIHDVIFLRYPRFYKWIDRKIYTYKFRKACLDADKVIAISEMTKRDIMDFFHIDEKKIEVVYQGCDKSFGVLSSTEKKESIRKKYNLPDKFILNVGSIEERKNLLLLVKALQYVDKDISLIAVGRPTSYSTQVKQYIEDNNLSDRVVFLHNIPFSELPTIYQCASLFVYPSFFEGFGIPILEALTSGVPVIGATGSCLEEAGGPGSMYVNPTDEKELAKKIQLVFSSSSLAQQMINAGKEYIDNFSDEVLAKRLIKIYQEL